ncbi:MAG: hypothetical protein JO156_11310, partial [Solirubrobacterales bacterium]|nr:hypothetical protein [Solirubrobacterales bacterium]
NWMRLGARVPGTRLQPTEINGSPGALLLDSEDRLIGVWALEIGRAEILAINSVINPDQLAHLGPTADVSALLRSAVRGG